MSAHLDPLPPAEIFRAELLPEEKLEWTGRPDPSIIFHSEDWFLIPFSVLWGGFAIFWLLGASGIWDVFSNRPPQMFHWFGVVWGTPFVVVGQYMIWGRFLYASWLKGRTYYALTSSRALIVKRGLTGRSSSSAYFASLSMVDKRVESSGMGHISFGGPVTGEWQWGKNNPPRPPTFSDLEDANSVYRIAIRLYDRARRTDRG